MSEQRCWMKLKNKEATYFSKDQHPLEKLPKGQDSLCN